MLWKFTEQNPSSRIIHRGTQPSNFRSAFCHARLNINHKNFKDCIFCKPNTGCQFICQPQDTFSAQVKSPHILLFQGIYNY